MDEYDVTVECNMQDTAYLEKEGILCSGEYGPCVVICVYDPLIKRGDMFHYAIINDSLVQSFLEETIQRSQDESALKVHLRGCGGSTVPTNLQESQNLYTSSMRSDLSRIVNNYFSHTGQVDTKWSQPETRGISFLDVSSGEFTSIEDDPIEFNPHASQDDFDSYLN